MNPLNRLLDPGLLIPVISILMPVALALIAAFFATRYQERKHQTIVNLLEKGLPVPRELLRPTRREGSPIMRALTFIGIGLGVSGFLAAMFHADYGLWAAGLIPLAVGVAQLIALKLEPARPEVVEPSTIDLT